MSQPVFRKPLGAYVRQPARSWLARLNAVALDKAHSSVARGLEERHVSRLQARSRRLDAGGRAFVDKPALKRAARFLHARVKASRVKRLVDTGLEARYKIIFDEVRRHIAGETVLDFGSGSGKIGKLVAEKLGKKVTLCDVFDYNGTDLPLRVYTGKKLPFRDGEFDCSYAIMVLHHSNTPLDFLDELFRVTSSRIILLETVYFNEPHRWATGFLDWVYNRVFNHPDINVPMNFLRPAGWVKELERRGGKVVHMEHLGIDQPIAPKWHVLYVVDLDKKK